MFATAFAVAKRPDDPRDSSAQATYADILQMGRQGGVRFVLKMTRNNVLPDLSLHTPKSIGVAFCSRFVLIVALTIALPNQKEHSEAKKREDRLVERV